MLIGYARVSTGDQSLALQKDALNKAGCERIFSDKVSGAKADRPGLTRAMDVVRGGDTLVVWKLDRLGRSLQDLVQSVNNLQQQHVGFKSLQENIDTTSGTGKLIFHLFAALAEFERDLIVERTRAGLAAARARGRNGGRPFKLTSKKINQARTMYEKRSIPVREICDTFGVSRATFYRYIKGQEHGDNKG